MLLKFTASTRTTENEPLRPGVRADVCRSVAGAACAVMVSQPLRPGVNELHDRLPEDLRGSSPALLMYRVELVNPNGRSAGWGVPAYSVSGPAPAAIALAKVEMRDDGALISWAESRERFDRVVLSRVEDLPESAEKKRQSPVLLEVATSPGDPQGAIDRGVQVGHSYSYELRRVRRVELAARTVEVSSEVTRVATGTLRDMIAPTAPTGVEAVASADAISLSWLPNPEADVAGYFVYRRKGGGVEWQRLNAQPSASPQFNDAAVTKGETYTYAVTAVDRSKNESVKSSESVQEMR